MPSLWGVGAGLQQHSLSGLFVQHPLGSPACFVPLHIAADGSVAADGQLVGRACAEMVSSGGWVGLAKDPRASGDPLGQLHL